MSHKDGIKAEISVFFALITAIIFALFLSIVESARTQAARLHLAIAANSAIDSLFSQYHKELWDKYRLLGLEQYAYEQLTDEMSEFIEPYFKAEDRYPMSLSGIDLEEVTCITDENGEIFEEEILDYMKYGIAAAIWDMTDIDIFKNGITEGTAVDNVSELYDGHTREAARIEEQIDDINELLKNITESADRAESAAKSFNGSGFINCAEETVRLLEKLPGEVEKYGQLADKLKEGLEESEKEAEERRASGDIGDETWQLINADMEEYQSYIDEDGQRRAEISALKDSSEAGISLFNELISEADSIEEYIDSWEPEDEDDELDEYELWEPVIDAVSGYERPHIGASCGIKDKEKLGQIENAKDILSGEVLKLVLPEGAEVSTAAFDMSDAPSSICYVGYDEDRLGLIDSVYIAEYMSSETDYFGRGVYDEESRKGSGQLEQEYILEGLETDEKNLSAVVKRLIAMRSGLNLMYLYSDSEKREEARALALAVTGAAALTPLTAVVCFLIMSTWALGQAVADIRMLLKGGKVPFMHTRDSFSLSLDNLLKIGSLETSEDDESGKGTGLSYKDYLKMFMFFDMGSRAEYRCMDIIEMNLRKNQSDFKMDRLVYHINARVNVKAAHVYSEVGTVKAFGGLSESGYDMSVSTGYSY